MGLLSSIFKRSAAAPAAKPVSDSADAVQQLRLRARRRLIGAAVLVVIGVIGFPLLFETQPRPIPVDLPIDIPRKEAAVPLVIPAPQTNNPAQETAGQPTAMPAAPTAVLPSAPAIAADSREAGAAVMEDKSSAKPVVSTAKTADRIADKQADKVADKAASKNQEAARVQALLEGKSGPKASEAASGGRFIVQVGAYADAKAAQEARMKVERLGLKTYTQVLETAEGRRIRVRIGPFASRDEADKAAARVRGGGLATAVLSI